MVGRMNHRHIGCIAKGGERAAVALSTHLLLPLNATEPKLSERVLICSYMIEQAKGKEWLSDSLKSREFKDREREHDLGKCTKKRVDREQG